MVPVTIFTGLYVSPRLKNRGGGYLSLLQGTADPTVVCCHMGLLSRAATQLYSALFSSSGIGSMCCKRVQYLYLERKF